MQSGNGPKKPLPVAAGRKKPAGNATNAKPFGKTARRAALNIAGVDEAELSPALRRFVRRLMTDVDKYRSEAEALRTRLREVEEAADRDSLLPVLNRRAFVRELSRVIAFSARYRVQSCLVYVDLNNFKSINDRYGHAAGDVVLRHVSETFLAQVRASDYVGRLGGDEFAIILTQADLEQAESKALQLNDYLAAHPARFEGSLLPIGFSFGVYALEKGDNPEAALARADEAMYAAKLARRAGAQ